MSYIRHESLFSLQDLIAMEQKHRFSAIFLTLDIQPILRLVSKKSRLGAPIDVHYSAMSYSLIARIIERIPTRLLATIEDVNLNTLVLMSTLQRLVSRSILIVMIAMTLNMKP